MPMLQLDAAPSPLVKHFAVPVAVGKYQSQKRLLGHHFDVFGNLVEHIVIKGHVFFISAFIYPYLPVVAAAVVLARAPGAFETLIVMRLEYFYFVHEYLVFVRV